MSSSSETIRSSSPFSRIMSVLRRVDGRSQRPSGSSRNNVDLIANLEGNRAFQSSKSFVTQGVILPVNIDKSSLSVVKRNEAELEIIGKLDSDVTCQVSCQCDSWKQKYFTTILNEGLNQEFSLMIPNFASFGPKNVELIISQTSDDIERNRDGKFSNPFYVTEQFTKLSLNRNENGSIILKTEDQYIKLRNKNFSLLEIFGKPLSSIRSTASSPTSYCSDGLSNRECIVCMSEVKDTIVLPCRHMCLCSECADTIRGRSDKCPLCRQGFRALLHLALGYWIVICAFLSPDDLGNPVPFDIYVFIPGLIVLICMILLNSFTTRQVIFNDEGSFFDPENSKGAKFLVYFCLSVSVIAVGSSFAIGAMIYQPEAKSLLSFATISNSVSTFSSSLIIFFGRELDYLHF